MDVTEFLVEDTNPSSGSGTTCALGSGHPFRRTKIVFYDSDDDDATVADGGGATAVTSQVEVHVTEEYRYEMDEQELLDDDSQSQGQSRLEVDVKGEEAAGSGKQGQRISCPKDDLLALFVEDVSRNPVSSLLEGLPSLPFAGGDGCPSLRHQVVPIDTEELLHFPPPPHQRATDGQRSRMETKPAIRKRFRADNDEEGEVRVVDDTDAGKFGTTEGDADVTTATEEVLELGDNRARHVDGYCLTLNEEDLQDEFPDDGEEDEEDGESSSDEELDNLVVVAAVEQLVRCCEEEAESVPQYTRFLEKAKPQLEAVYRRELPVASFAEGMARDVEILTRVFRRVNRPRDAPIVIDGVLMDM